MPYDYKAGKKRVQAILNSGLSVKTERTIPSVAKLTHNNSYKTWITGIFVDIRKSADLFSKEDQVMISKIIKSFTSEVVTVLKDTNLNCLEQGIRGDCVYAIYNTPAQVDMDKVLDISYWINTLINMLNKLFSQKGYPQIQIGIGISTAEELIIKAGRYTDDPDENIDNNAVVWVGKAVSLASKFSSFGHKNGTSTIVISEITYGNINDDNKSFFSSKIQDGYKIYHGGVTKIEFNNWVNAGMY